MTVGEVATACNPSSLPQRSHHALTQLGGQFTLQRPQNPMCQVLLAEKDAALAALAQRLAQLEVGQGARAQLQALDARSARLRVRARAKGYVLQGAGVQAVQGCPVRRAVRYPTRQESYIKAGPECACRVC